ncbi:MAG: PilZ domain-containing protein [Gammaproteobacteria bacterium]
MANQIAVQEKRQFSRIAFDAPVHIISEGAQCNSTLLDISFKGALIRRPEHWQYKVGSSHNLIIKLNEDDCHIDMDVTIAHIEEDHIGFHCEHIDIDSISRLRRLVELNLGDQSLLERELSALA